VHGGRQARDVWGWDPEGMAGHRATCASGNYRGSTGYGKSFVAAGDREGAHKMHDDCGRGPVAVDQGWAAARGSRSRRVLRRDTRHGGAAFTRDVFCCAVESWDSRT